MSLLNKNNDLLDSILSNGLITPVYQPIFDLISGQTYGHEALSRGPKETVLFSADVLFSLATQEGRLHELELLCRERSLIRFAELSLSGRLFLNVSASLLGSPDHQKGMTLNILNHLGLDQRNIIIELSEQHPHDNNGLSIRCVEYYRKMGFQVAIDDLGVGYSGLRLWSELQPEIVKIDKHFIGHIGGDDFVVIFGDANWQQQCQRILDDFAKAVRYFYTEKVLADGGVWTQCRQGNTVFHTILSLAIGVVKPNPEKSDNPHHVAELAAQAKKSAKQKGGNTIYFQPYQSGYFDSNITL